MNGKDQEIGSTLRENRKSETVRTRQASVKADGVS